MPKFVKKLLILAFLVVVGSALFAHPALAALSFPATPCDAIHENPVFHLTPSMTREDGATAFKYGLDNNSFVSVNGDVLTFTIDLLFPLPADPTQSLVKVLAFDQNCFSVNGLGPTHRTLQNGTNILTYNKSTFETVLNGFSRQSFPSSIPRYIWIEVLDNYPTANFASYSYLIDLENPQNPTGSVGEPERNPVIIIPGITGTELFNGTELVWLDGIKALSISDELLDALLMDENGISINAIEKGDIVRQIKVLETTLLNYSEGLIQELESKGYIENVDLFVFPYDWREDIENISQELDSFLQSNFDANQKVDIIAHSMGGLVAKKYILDFGKDRIDKLIFVGTPHLGAPKSAKTLLFGDLMSIPILNPNEIKKIGKNMPSLYQLLPNQLYFSNIGFYLKSPDLLDYIETKVALNIFGLNGLLINEAEDFYESGINNLDLSGLNAFNINGCNTATLGSFRVTSDLSISPSDILPKMVAGDGTVPLGSSNYVSVPGANNFFVKKASHSTMMTQNSSKNLIVSILTGESYSDANITQDVSQCKLKGKLLGIFSPVDMKITDQDGNYAGPNEFDSFTNDIPGVAYEVLGSEKFVFLPTDEGQSYQIELDATDTGTFDLKISDIDDEVQSTIYFNEISISPESEAVFDISEISDDTAIAFDFEGDGSYIELSADAVLNSLESTDETPPQTSIGVSGVLGENDWYKSDVEITLVGTDDNSDILQTEYSLDDGATWSPYTSPIIISDESGTTIQFFSTDRAGNREAVQTKTFRIDKTPPEAVVSFNPNTKDLDISGVDNLTQVTVQASGNDVVLSDEAGNRTTLTIEKLRWSKLLTVKIKELSYNNNNVPLNSNVLAFGWLLDKTGEIKELSQSALIIGDFVLTLYYSSRTDQTVIKGLDNGTIISETKPGMEILKIKTNNGNIEYEY